MIDNLYDSDEVEEANDYLEPETDVSDDDIVARSCDSSEEEGIDLGKAVRKEFLSHDSMLLHLGLKGRGHNILLKIHNLIHNVDQRIFHYIPM